MSLVARIQTLEEGMTVLIRAIALVLPLCFVGCATSSSSSNATDVEDARDVRFTRSEMAKLDRPLRDRVRARDGERIPIRVEFESDPDEHVLSEMLLIRTGTQIIGQVPLEVLKQIVRREDVRTIRLVTNVGYTT